MKNLNKNFYKSCRHNPTWQLKHIYDYLQYRRKETLRPGIKGSVFKIQLHSMFFKPRDLHDELPVIYLPKDMTVEDITKKIQSQRGIYVICGDPYKIENPKPNQNENRNNKESR